MLCPALGYPSLLSHPIQPLLLLYPHDPVSLLVCAWGQETLGGTVSLFEAGPMEDQVSQVGQAGASACWGRDCGFQVFNSPRFGSLPGDPCCVVIVTAWEPRPPSQTEPGLPAPGA